MDNIDENEPDLQKTAEALGELADLLETQPADSSMVKSFIESHRGLPEFTDLCQQALRLHAAFPRAQLESHIETAPKSSVGDRIGEWVAGFVGVAAIILISSMILTFFGVGRDRVAMQTTYLDIAASWPVPQERGEKIPPELEKELEKGLDMVAQAYPGDERSLQRFGLDDKNLSHSDAALSLLYRRYRSTNDKKNLVALRTISEQAKNAGTRRKAHLHVANATPVPESESISNLVLRMRRNASFGLTARDPDNDLNLKLTYAADGWSNSCVLLIDKHAVPFGSPVGDWSEPFDPPKEQVERNTASWLYRDIKVIQELKLVKGAKGKQLCVVQYEIINTGKAAQDVGLRFLLDILLGDNDAPAFREPSGSDPVTDGKEWSAKEVPPSLTLFQFPRREQPGLTANLTVQPRRASTEKPEKLQVTKYPEDTDTWEVPSAEKLEGDAVIVMYWPERRLAPDEHRIVEFAYGLEELREEVIARR